ncbi:VOC family protein [Chitinimonas naiadis]
MGGRQFETSYVWGSSRLTTFYVEVGKGIPCIGLNGGPMFKHSEAFSFQIATDDQAETDRYWNAIVGNGGQESQCGWCKDKWGINWQITPRVLTDAMAKGGAPAKRAFEAMMSMRKIDVAVIEAAVRG